MRRRYPAEWLIIFEPKSRCMLNERHVDVAGRRLRVIENIGRAGTPMLVFNGIGASAELLRPLLNRLKSPALTFDLPGIGKSRPTILPRRMADHADLARQLLDTLGIEACHLLGLSWGGTLAQQFARQFPARTRRLVLAATCTGHLMIPPSALTLVRMAMSHVYPGHFHRVAGEVFGGDLRRSPERVAEHFRGATAASLNGYLGQLFALSGWTSLFWLHELKAPTLILAGTDDPLVPLANARLLARRIPDARLKLYDCGHLFLFTRLEQVCSDIEAFIDRLSPASRVH